jgi:hypothetical protein
MTLVDTYAELLESDREFDAMPAVPSLQQAVGELADVASEEGLTTSGAWRISQEAATRMEHRTGYRPPGGWRRLAALAAGAPILKAKRELFALSDDTPWRDWDEGQTRRELVEAFSQGLVPPTTAAGLFIMLGVHPAWGVHVAHRARKAGESDLEASKMFPTSTLETVHEVVGVGWRPWRPGRRF